MVPLQPLVNRKVKPTKRRKAIATTGYQKDTATRVIPVLGIIYQKSVEALVQKAQLESRVGTRSEDLTLLDHNALPTAGHNDDDLRTRMRSASSSSRASVRSHGRSVLTSTTSRAISSRQKARANWATNVYFLTEIKMELLWPLRPKRALHLPRPHRQLRAKRKLMRSKQQSSQRRRPKQLQRRLPRQPHPLRLKSPLHRVSAGTALLM